MQDITVLNADTGRRGAQKENIFLALDASGQPLGFTSIYPFYDDDLEPEHPHNLYRAVGFYPIDETEIAVGRYV
jgi:hypothetical protein